MTDEETGEMIPRFRPNDLVTLAGEKRQATVIGYALCNDRKTRVLITLPHGGGVQRKIVDEDALA